MGTVWALVVIASTGMGQGGVAIGDGLRFHDLEQCSAAAEAIKKDHDDKHWGPITVTCVEVRP